MSHYPLFNSFEPMRKDTKPTTTYYLVDITTYCPQNSFQFAIANEIEKFNRITISDPLDYSKSVQGVLDEISFEHFGNFRAIIEPAQTYPNNGDLGYRICFSGIIFITFDLIKMSKIKNLDQKTRTKIGDKRPALSFKEAIQQLGRLLKKVFSTHK